MLIKWCVDKLEEFRKAAKPRSYLSLGLEEASFLKNDVGL
jgi:hypothetical protein